MIADRLRYLRLTARLLLMGVLLALAAAAPAYAGYEYGTPAWALRELTLRDGPGAAYAVTGGIADRSRIVVERCAPRWCLVNMGSSRGWTSRGHVGFGQQPWPKIGGPRLSYGAGGPGRVCFYPGTHYTGPSVCHGSGFIAHDLKLHGADDLYASVSVEGNVSVTVCRDRNFRNWCTRIVTSTPVLDTYLAGKVSSLRVH